MCKIFKCSARSLLRWVDKYNENGEIKGHNRKPVSYKVHKDQVKFILDEIKKNKTITMQDLLEKLKEKYENIFKGAYNRTEKYVKKPSNRTRKLKNYLP